MSELFNYTPQNTTTINQVNSLATEVDAAFVLLENLIISDDNNYNASIDSSIGSLDTYYLKEYNPTGNKIIGFQEQLIFPSFSKEASLTINPSTDLTDLNSITITNLSNPSEIYTYKNDSLLINDNDFTINNRKIIFKTRPVDELTITYNGFNFAINPEKLRYNVMSFDGTDTFPVTTISTNEFGIYGYDYKSKCSLKIKNLIDNNYENLLSYFSIFKEASGNLTKLKLTSITVTNTSILFETANSETLTNVKVFVANTSIGDLLEHLYQTIYTHDHFTNEGKSIEHKSLLGLFNNTDTIKYIVTNKENYDHPQYLNREGYINDPTVYNNALLGDLLVSSTDDANYFNNLNSNSNSITFGSYSNGIKVYYDVLSNSLKINCGEDKNGLSISTGFNKNILKLNTHIISDIKTIDDIQYLEYLLEEDPISNFGILKLNKKVINSSTLAIESEDSAKLFTYAIETSVLDVKQQLNIKNNSKIQFGTPVVYEVKLDNLSKLSFNPIGVDTTNHSVKFNLTTEHNKLLANTANIENIILDNLDSKLSFGNSEYITYLGNYLTLKTDNYINIDSNGYRKGLSLNNKYWLYPSVSNGDTIPSGIVTTNLFLETSLNGSLYVIKNTENNFIKGNDDLTTLPKADIYSNINYVNSININYNSSTTNGINLDNADNNKIFAGKNANGNLATILKSNSKVTIVNSYTPSSIGTPVILYGELESGKYTSPGNKNTDNGYYGNVFIPTDNKLVIDGDASFNSDILFEAPVTINSKLTVQEVAIKEGTAEYFDISKELTVLKINADESNKSRFGDLEVRQNLEVSKQIIQNSANAENILNGSLRVVGSVKFLSGLDVNSSIITGVINSTEPSGDEAVSYSRLVTEQALLEQSLQTQIDNKIDAALNDFLDRIYPIGHLFFNESDQRNPFDIIRFGVWIRALEGRSPMGIIESNYLATNTNIPEDVKAGLGVEIGEYEHSLTADENGPHTHRWAESSSGGGYDSGTHAYAIDYPEGGPAVGKLTSNSGLGKPHNTIHPVTLVSIWKRVA